MTKIRKYIAFIFLGIFFFPIVFQSIHIVWHDSYANEHNYHKITCKNSHSNEKNISQEEENCLICEYNFSINDLPKIYFLSIEIPEITHFYNEFITKQPNKQVLSGKIPRAPPIFIS